MTPPLRFALALAALSLSACAAAPQRPVDRALYLDLRRVVETRQRTDWVVDRLEVESLASTAMRSTCSVDDTARIRVADWIARRIAEEGGSAEEIYRARGEDMGAAQEAITLERVGMLLRYGDDHRAECPFWLRREARFAGVHGDARRFVLLLESQGGGALILSGGTVSVGGGASARLLPAFGINERITLAMGLEAGGLGTFGASEGDRSLRATVLGAVPLLLRVQSATRMYDFEVAATGRFFQDGASIQPGVRASFGMGLSTLRVGPFMPFGLLWVGYEFQPPAGDAPTTHTFRVGTRVGIDWDP